MRTTAATQSRQGGTHTESTKHTKGFSLQNIKMPLFVFFVPLCESKKTHYAQNMLLFFVTEHQEIRH